MSSRLRMLAVGIKHNNNFKVARHFLVYHAEDLTLVPEDVMDDAIRIEEIENKRAQRRKILTITKALILLNKCFLKIASE